MNSKCKTFIFL